jgi:hypothetical protein
MLVHLVAALLQVPAQPPAPVPQAPAPANGATVKARPDTTANAGQDTTASARRRRRREQRTPRRDSVTAEHLATAYRGTGRDILALARAARMRQDSALQSYDATTYQRISAGFGLGRIGRDRLAFRSEQATHVQWRRGVGAYVDITGSRAVMPIGGKSGKIDIGGNVSPIPYYPGRETLWIGTSAARPDVDENQGMVHPLAVGSEAYYTFESGDSLSFRLPDGKTVQLRELKVRPRQPKWNLAVGSLWFDMSGGQLVRAAYRMAVPMDIKAVAEKDDSSSFDDVPMLIKPLLFPMTMQVSAIGVEYGLFEGRFWLPRLQVLEGGANMSFMRVPFKLEQRYEYSQVNAGAPLPPIKVPPDSVRRRGEGVNISMRIGESSPSPRDSARAARRMGDRAKCDSTGTRSYVRSRDSINVVLVRIPCDSAKLANSPDLPPSIYEKGEETFGGEEMDALVAEALTMGAQAGFAPQLPTTELVLPRYNRVEGLSLGARADQVLGNGYSAHAIGRIGIADREPNVELTGSRSDLRRTLSLTAYNRLVSASDYGTPMSFGSSIGAFLFARDEGYYYRASGVELTSAPDQPQANAWSWGLFAEQERSAPRRTTFAVARGATGFSFDTNLVANRGLFYGARTRLVSSYGVDPEGFRLFSDMKLEAARADTGTYGRIALDLTLSRAIGNGAAALTLAGGTSIGVLPIQRDWFLGGSQTVRGQRAALEPGRMGNAFWFARGEVGHGLGIARPVAFVDLGWAGDRTRWRDIGQPISGAGVGMSLMDGLVRFDVARGIHPDRAWRVYTYLEGRF